VKHLLHEKPQRSEKVAAWCAIGMCGITGHDFFAVTVNTDRYSEMLQNFLIPELRARQFVDRIPFGSNSSVQ
jgi:hypothetical protein